MKFPAMPWSTKDEPTERLEGLVCPMLTPLTFAGKLDASALERLIERSIAGGISAIFLLGTTGEAPSLSREFKRDLIARGADLIASRTPLIVGVSHTSLDESLDLAAFAAEKGASAVVSTTPYYYPLSQTGVRRWFEALAERQSLPVILYNYPKMTKTAIEIDTAVELLSHSNVHALKDSSGEIDYVRALCERMAPRRDRSILVGPQRLLAGALEAGAQGGVCAGTNLFPAAYVALHRAWKAGKRTEFAQLSERVERVFATLAPTGSDTLVTSLKAAASALGLCEAHPAFPLAQHPNAENSTFADAIRALREELEPGENSGIGASG